jgi:ABC-2 type transport system ATP-binding protein
VPDIQLSGVTFQYLRKRTSSPALHEVTADLRPGITGIVGPNGAGKSTLLRLLMGSLQPLTGSIMIDGMPPAEYRRANPFGFVPDRAAFDEFLTVRAFLDGLSRLLGLRGGVDAPSSIAWQWQELGEKHLGELSLGQARRVELAAALVGGPAVVLLDEPTNGLDPLSVRELRETLTELNNGGRTILVASHHLDELQRIADSILVIREGRIVDFATSAEIIARFGSFESYFLSQSSDPAEGGTSHVA